MRRIVAMEEAAALLRGTQLIVSDPISQVEADIEGKVVTFLELTAQGYAKVVVDECVCYVHPESLSILDEADRTQLELFGE